MKNKKGNATAIVIIVVLVAITVSAITCVVTTKIQEPVQQANVSQPAPVTKTQPTVPTTHTTVADETALWQTYSNSEYSFKYPNQKINFELSDNNSIDQEVNSIFKVNNDNYRAFHFSPINKEMTSSLAEAYLGELKVNKNIPTGMFVDKSLDDYLKKQASVFIVSSVIKSKDGLISWQCGFSTTQAGGKFKDCLTQINKDVYQVRFQLDSKGYFTEDDFNGIVESFQIVK